MAYSYGTARALLMVGSLHDPNGQQARRIGPAHATLPVHGPRGRRSLCGTFVANDEELPWPPETIDCELCPTCRELALL